jgi:cephalosporin-C deacetylase-like acetyl esterase
LPPDIQLRRWTAAVRADYRRMSEVLKADTLNGHVIRGLNDAPENLLYRQIFLDTVQLDRVVMDFPKVDPQHQREDEIYTKLGYIDVQHLAVRIRGEVLFVTGLMDTVCPPSTQFAAYNKIKAPKQMAVYPDFHHGERYPAASDRIFEFITGL